MMKSKKLKYDKIVMVDPSEVKWDFNGGKPYYNLNMVLCSYGVHIDIDPFPCTGHDINLLSDTVKKVENKFTIGSITRWIVIKHDTTHYTNAWAQKSYIGDNDNREKYKFEGTIVMAGKRTIIHPSMTKYLVAHEYGHLVDYWITAKMNEEADTTSEDTFRKAYAEMRGIEFNDGYGGGRWIDNIGEIIADDFRIVIANTDKDFYLHTCTHPLKHPKVKAFWRELKKKYAII